MAIITVLLACFVSVAVAGPQQLARNLFNFENEVQQFNLDDNFKETTTPVPILRHVDTQNPDGSYTYGYESGDGSYKIETRYATGEVKGKYGYYDDTGYLRQVEYGAAPERGFEPRSEGLIVAPPTISEPEFNPEPVIAQPPAAPVRNFKNFEAKLVRKTVVRRPRPRPAVPQQPQFQPQQRITPVAPQRSQFRAQQRFTPVAPQQQSGPLPSSVSFFNHPYISDFNGANGVFSYSYGR